MTEGVRHVRFDLGYDGTEFFGSQRQRDLRTVQSVVEEALGRLTGSPVTLAFAGRTDRGVHATGQVASGRVRWQRDEESLRYALDSLTPNDVSIVGARDVGERFHARFSAREREYRFRVWNGPVPAAMIRRFTWHVRSDLDLVRMNTAASRLIGRQDFSSLAGAGVGVPGSQVDCTRTVLLAEWRELTEDIERRTNSERLLEFRVRADRFLPHMVRNMVGAMIEVGRGGESAEWFASMLSKRDRRFARPPAPGAGLALWSVEYPEGSEV